MKRRQTECKKYGLTASYRWLQAWYRKEINVNLYWLSRINWMLGVCPNHLSMNKMCVTMYYIFLTITLYRQNTAYLMKDCGILFHEHISACSLPGTHRHPPPWAACSWGCTWPWWGRGHMRTIHDHKQRMDVQEWQRLSPQLYSYQHWSWPGRAQLTEYVLFLLRWIVVGRLLGRG